MSGPSELAAKGCGKPSPPISFKDAINKYSDFLQSLGLNSCKTNSYAFASSYSYADSFWGSGDSSSGSQSLNTKDTSGCSAINILLQQYNSAINDVACIINQETKSSDIDIKQVNSVSISAGGNLTMNCPAGLSSTQTIGGTIKIVNTQNLSSAVKSKIQDAVTSRIQSFTNQLKNMYKGQPEYGSDGQGTQNVDQVLSSSTQNQIKNNISDTITSFETKIDNENNITLVAGGNITLSGSDCVFGQDIQIKVISNSIVTNAFQAAFSSVNLPSMIPPLPFKPSVSKTKYYLVGVIVIMILIVVGYYLYKKYKKPAGMIQRYY